MYHLKRAAQKTLKKKRKAKSKVFLDCQTEFQHLPYVLVFLSSHTYFNHVSCTEGGKKPLSRAGPEVCGVISICTVALRHSETQPMTAGFLCQVVRFQTWSDDLAYFRRTELLTLYWASCEAGSKALWCLCVILRIAKGLETNCLIPLPSGLRTLSYLKRKKTKQMDIWVTGWISASKTWVKAMDCKRVYLNPNHDLLSQQAAAVVRSLHWRCEPQMETCESFLTCCLLLRQITARRVDASVCKQVGIFHANYGKQWQPASNQSTHK